jgi:hypothetical protein
VNLLQRRFQEIVKRSGENFTVSATTHKGIFGILPPGMAARYLTQAVLDASERPIRSVYVAWDDTTAFGDIATWDSLDWTVQKVVSVRNRGVVVAKLLVLTEGIA